MKANLNNQQRKSTSNQNAAERIRKIDEKFKCKNKNKNSLLNEIKVLYVREAK